VPTPHGLLCGATRQADDTDPDIRQADHLLNLARLRSLTGLEPKPETGHWQGRVAWRLHADDRMPIAGPVPLISWPARPGGQRMDQPRLVPREPGLFVLTALGARGLSLAPLLGRLVAAQATGTPWPLEQDLADAVDPARWIVRAARQPG
jgi:tRNA 5-methylaminomethyl-2-thiouridine biosynthesis bifunctional protein